MHAIPQNADSHEFAISIEKVSKIYHPQADTDVEALRPVELAIDEGDFVCLVGPSGCGKSSLLNIIAGFESPSAGLMKVDGARVAGPNIERGMVFQDYALFPWLSVEDNVAFGLQSRGMKRSARKTRAREYLELVGLADFARKKPNELSGGMKQRVALARAFATDPRIILMDEPFGALDALTRRLLQNELLNIWQTHRKTVVMVTHSVQEAVVLSNRVVVMTARPGRVKLDYRIDLPYPRDISSDGFRDHEKRILAELDEELTATYNGSIS